MSPRRRFRLLLAALCVFSCSAGADQVVIDGNNHPNTKVVGLENGQVQFQKSGNVAREWVHKFDRIVIDRDGPFADFNEAEKYLAEGRPGEAIVRYRRAGRRTAGFWQDLIDARLFRACERASRIEHAALTFVRLLRSQRVGVSVVRSIPTSLHVVDQGDAGAALKVLDEALGICSDPADRAVLQLFSFYLRTESRLAPESARDATAELELPDAVRCDRAFAIQLTALGSALQERPTEARLVALDGFIRHCPEEMLPQALLLKGRALLETAQTRDELVRASWPFLRVAIHMTENPLAAEGLLGAAEVMEALDRPDKAVELLEECLAHQAATQATKDCARKALERIRPGATPPGAMPPSAPPRA